MSYPHSHPTHTNTQKIETIFWTNEQTYNEPLLRISIYPWNISNLELHVSVLEIRQCSSIDVIRESVDSLCTDGADTPFKP